MRGVNPAEPTTAAATVEPVAGPHARWHAGERALQERAGSAETLASAAPRVLRPFMSEQHRTFFAQLPFLVTGCIDDEGWPWASFIVGGPNFAWRPDPRSLRIDAMPPAGDPLGAVLAVEAPLALLGIDLSTRRRARLNGRVTEIDAQGFLVGVDQSFGNCPQYIQRRDYAPPQTSTPMVSPSSFADLDDDEARALISRCDTFFVATYIPGEAGDGPAAPAADVSHRGGRPGFVRVDPNGMLTIPDFAGNRYFNTLGNILVNPRAGIVVPDFERGDLLLLTGGAWLGVEDEDRAETQQVEGAERLWRIKPSRGLWLRNALPIRFAFQDWSPRTIATGSWA